MHPYSSRIICAASAISLMLLNACGYPLPATPTVLPTANATRTLSQLGTIVFTALVPDGREIFSVQADGTRLVNLTHHPSTNWCPRWSPDSQRLAFWAGPLGGPSDLYVMNADGSGGQSLRSVDGGDGPPSWSPDGKRITFSGGIKAGNLYIDDIWVIEVDTLRATNLTRDAATDFAPAWSPDGRKIAFASDRDLGDFHREIYTMDVDGSHIQRLTVDPTRGEQPAWSPDGKKIAYTCYRGSDPGICTVKADGSDRRELTKPEDYPNATDPSWSPDGLRIVYVETHTDQSNLYVMNARDGSGRVQLTDISRTSLSGAVCPAWQPMLPK